MRINWKSVLTGVNSANGAKSLPVGVKSITRTNDRKVSSFSDFFEIRQLLLQFPLLAS